MPLTIYSTPWCGYCRRLQGQLDRAGISYDVIDIGADAEAAAYVMSVNGGNRTVPTVLFEDGTTLTNPRLGEIAGKLEAVASLTTCS
jgi:mycoredoxin